MSTSETVAADTPSLAHTISTTETAPATAAPGLGAISHMAHTQDHSAHTPPVPSHTTPPGAPPASSGSVPHGASGAPLPSGPYPGMATYDDCWRCQTASHDPEYCECPTCSDVECSCLQCFNPPIFDFENLTLEEGTDAETASKWRANALEKSRHAKGQAQAGHNHLAKHPGHGQPARCTLVITTIPVDTLWKMVDHHGPATDNPPYNGQRPPRSDRFCQEYSWCVPSPELIETIQKFACDREHQGRTFEPCAGLGMISHFVEKSNPERGCTTEPSDNFSWNFTQSVSNFTFVRAKQGTTAVVDALRDHLKVMVISWPTCNDPSSHKILKTFIKLGGRKVAYIGAPCDPYTSSSHCVTGTAQFHRLLTGFYTLQHKVDIPQWNGMIDAAYCYQRNSRNWNGWPRLGVPHAPPPPQPPLGRPDYPYPPAPYAYPPYPPAPAGYPGRPQPGPPMTASQWGAEPGVMPTAHRVQAKGKKKKGKKGRRKR